MQRAPSSRARRARPAPALHGEANLRVFDAGGLVETPFQDGRGSLSLAGRYGYPGPVLGAITPTIKLGYWDYQGRATWRLTDRDTVGVFAFGSHDYLGTASVMNGQVGPIVEQLVSDFHRVDVRYDHALTDGNLRIAATLGHDSQGGAGTSEDGAPVMITDPLGGPAARAGPAALPGVSPPGRRQRSLRQRTASRNRRRRETRFLSRPASTRRPPT